METIIILVIAAVLSAGSLIIGIVIGQRLGRGEAIRVPELDPTRVIQSRAEKAAQKAEDDRMAVILRNLERYDGTSYGQEEVPRR